MARKPVLLHGKYFPVTIKTKRFIKPYLESLYGNPVIFNSNNLFGNVISGLLERPHSSHENKQVIQFRVFDKLDELITIFFPKSWGKKYVNGFRPSGNSNYCLSDRAMLAFTKFYENQFEEDLYKFCELARIYKVETKSAIEDFCFRYHVNIGEECDDHITYDCLKQKEHRFRKLQKELKEKLPSELSLHFYTSKKVN